MPGIKAKEGADLLEGVRLAFNVMFWSDKSLGYKGYKSLPNKIDAEEKLRSWFFANLDGLPKQESETEPEKIESNVG